MRLIATELIASGLMANDRAPPQWKDGQSKKQSRQRSENCLVGSEHVGKIICFRRKYVAAKEMLC